MCCWAGIKGEVTVCAAASPHLIGLSKTAAATLMRMLDLGRCFVEGAIIQGTIVGKHRQKHLTVQCRQKGGGGNNTRTRGGMLTG